MGNIGKISPIKKQVDTEGGQSMSSSLASAGMTMFPGVRKGIQPYKERNGEYRTGLDPNALYIARMSPDEAAMERARVTALREELEALTKLDLSSRSEYYSKMFQDNDANLSARATYVKLEDKVNIFNLEDPQQAITFAWLRVHPEIAPSYHAWQSGKSSFRCPFISTCKFFVDDIEFESEVVYSQKLEINAAIDALQHMSPERQLKVAKLLALPVTYNTKPSIIYNALDEYIKETGTKQGKRINNVQNFNMIATMADENIDIRFRVKEALDLQVYRVEKLGKILEGTVTIADNEQELIEYLSNPKNQTDYLALIKKIDTAKSVLI